MKKKPYPICQCPDASYRCCGGIGPATFSVMREGKKLKLCTKCDLRGDTHKKILPWVKKAPASLLMNFDPLGAMVIALSIKTAK